MLKGGSAKARLTEPSGTSARRSRQSPVFTVSHVIMTGYSLLALGNVTVIAPIAQAQFAGKILFFPASGFRARGRLQDARRWRKWKVAKNSNSSGTGWSWRNRGIGVLFRPAGDS